MALSDRLRRSVVDAVLTADMELREAADRFNVPLTTVRRWVAEAEAIQDSEVGDPVPLDRLGSEAKASLSDFGLFGRRYLGRVNTPWQVEAANTVVGKLNSRRREFIVLNVAPGTGKSTVFAHDIPAWLTCRDRAIRGLLGHKASRTAGAYVSRLRRTLARPGMFTPSVKELEAGRAVLPEGSLTQDFGRFKPLIRDLWTASSGFIVEQVGGESVIEKEPTWTPVGMGSEDIGNRYPFINWDDLVTPALLRSAQQTQDQRDWWTRVAEERLEPHGVLMLVGQRLGPTDLYRFCLDMEVLADESAELYGDAELSVFDAPVEKRYTHIVFQAHDEERCEGKHHPSVALPQPHGCLLDPNRLPWRDISAKIQRRDGTFEVVLQQMDVAPAEMLVRKPWIWGGEDLDGTICPGSWDRDRSIGQAPLPRRDGLISYITVDPSGTNFWAVEHWLHSPDDDVDWLVQFEKRKYQAPDVLSWDFDRSVHTGVLEVMAEHASLLGHPVSYVVLEINAMNRWAAQQEIWKMWERARNIRTIPHTTTGANKADADRGVEAMCSRYRFGKVRLPGRSRIDELAVMPLVSELSTATTSNGTGRYAGDAMMGQWFGTFNQPNMVRGTLARAHGPARRRGLPWKMGTMPGRRAS